MKTPDFDAWFTARIVRDPDAAATAAGLYNDYRTWIEFHRPTELALSLLVFSDCLSNVGVRRHGRTSGGQILRHGVRLQPWAPHEDAPSPTSNDQAATPLDVLRHIKAALTERGAIIIDAGGPIGTQILAAIAQAEAA